MGKTRKWLHYIPDRISDGMRYVCGRMSPDVRLIVVVAMLVGFSALSIYITVDIQHRQTPGRADENRTDAAVGTASGHK